MRIDAYNQIAQVYKTDKRSKVTEDRECKGTDVMKYRSRLLAEIIRSQNRQSLKQRISGKIKSQN